MSPISLVSKVIIARHLVLMAKAMVAVSLASSLLLLLVVGGAVGLGDGGQAWGEGWEDKRQEEVEVEQVEGKVNNRQGRRLGEAEGIAAYNRVDTPFAGFHIFQGKKAKFSHLTHQSPTLSKNPQASDGKGLQPRRTRHPSRKCLNSTKSVLNLLRSVKSENLVLFKFVAGLQFLWSLSFPIIHLSAVKTRLDFTFN